MCYRQKYGPARRGKTLLQNLSISIDQALLGIAMMNQGLAVLENQRIIIRRDHKLMRPKVKILGGGGAGVEPCEACYVGPGMLTAAVFGEMFTAPPSWSILYAIRELAYECPDGILLLTKNYTGDRLNFGIAMEEARKEGIAVKMLVVGEDAAEPNPGKPGRRGLAGSVLVYKVAGAMAESLKSLDDIFNRCRDMCLTDISTVGLTLAMCSLPYCGLLDPHIREDEMVLGLGPHGQVGVRDFKVGSAAEAVTIVLDTLMPPQDPESQTSVHFTDCDVAVLINNHGSLSKLEEYVIAMETNKQLTERGLKVSRQYSGTFMSTLDMQGFSITILQLTCPDALAYLDGPTTATGWPRTCTYAEQSELCPPPPPELTPLIPSECPHDDLENKRWDFELTGPRLTLQGSQALDQVVNFAVDAIMSCERQLNVIDEDVGDGDMGSMLVKAALPVKTALQNQNLIINQPFLFLLKMSDIFGSFVGGTSGALYQVFFATAAKVIQPAEEITAELWCEAFKAAIRAVKHYGQAAVGDRSMLDALCPAADCLDNALRRGLHPSSAIYAAAADCEFQAAQTKPLLPRVGKASRVNKIMLHPDPGAHAVTIWLRAICEGVRLSYPPPEPPHFKPPCDKG